MRRVITPSRRFLAYAHARRYGAGFGRRAAAASGAVVLGLVALAFAYAADKAQSAFSVLVAHWPVATLALPPIGFAAIVWATRRWAPTARGSGIPQVIAAAHNPDAPMAVESVSLSVSVVKMILTCAVLLVGGSTGREGPTVQVSAAIMKTVHRFFRLPATAAVIIAGGAAGVSAAFNTPLAGVAFAIEELASAYEQRLALLVMEAVLISGLVSLGVAGDYLYFGEMRTELSVKAALVVCPTLGIVGGLCGGLFSRLVLAAGGSQTFMRTLRGRPVLWAAVCGAVVAFLGWASHGATWGAGYAAARDLVEATVPAHAQVFWFGPEKLIVTLATAASGVPGGIFAPSLAAGAGLGEMFVGLFPHDPVGVVVLLGMISYFVGVVRAPLTAVLIVSEMTDSRGMILPLFASALIADAVSALVCRDKLYHGLSKQFRDEENTTERDRQGNVKPSAFI